MKKLFLLLSIVIYSFGAKDFVSPDVAIKPSAEIKQNSIDIKLSLYKHIYVYDKKLKVLITKPKKIDLTNYIAKPATENFKGDQVIVKDFSLNVDELDSKIKSRTLKVLNSKKEDKKK